MPSNTRMATGTNGTMKLKNHHKTIEKIATKYNVSVVFEDVNCRDNQAACSGGIIYMGWFDDPDIELIAFFHEMGHAFTGQRFLNRKTTLCTISSEGLAWEIGLTIASEEGYDYPYNCKELKWARQQLETYRKDDDNWQ